MKKKAKKLLKKENKKSFLKIEPEILIKIILSIILIILVIFLVSINDKNQSNLTGKAITSLNMPASCSEENIKTLWDSIFKESSSGITITINDSSTQTPDQCALFQAYKIKNNQEAYILSGGVLILKVTNLQATYINYSKDYLNLTNINVSKLLEISLTNITQRNITSSDQAQTQFTNLFKIIPQNWEDSVINNQPAYSYTNTNNTNNKLITNIGGVYKNHTVDLIFYSQILYSSNCTPNWTSQNTSCLSNERRIIYFVDSANCRNNTSKPANISLYCDYDNNGIIGNLSTATLRRITPALWINNTLLNLSIIHTAIEKVELKEDNISLIEFNWNFSKPLNLENITLEKQSSTSHQGYMIINGINASKTIIIDKLNANSTSVCVKDQEISSISEISSNCNLTNELLINCPGTNNSISCNLTSNSTFKITGLMHSAVIEKSSIIQNNCIPKNCSNIGKTCGVWTENSCNTSITCGTCSSGNECINGTCQISCKSNWNCTEYLPKICPQTKNQTRSCIDLNKCQVPTEKPLEKKSCEYTSKTNTKTMIIIVSILIIIVIILMIYLALKNNSTNSFPTASISQEAPSLPPQDMPQNQDNP